MLCHVDSLFDGLLQPKLWETNEVDYVILVVQMLVCKEMCVIIFVSSFSKLGMF